MKNIVKKYNPLEDKMFQVMDDEGNIINSEYMPDLSDEKKVEIYKFLNYARTADLMAVSYQRQGRMFTYPPNLGQEAISSAAGYIMDQNDWFVPAFRELGGWLKLGAKMRDIFLYYGGHEDGSLWSGVKNILPMNVPIASQLLHATGIGFALNYKNEKAAVFGFVGDGGTSQGDFHEALNYASVWKAPVIFTVQNNQYAISLPIAKQTNSINLAVKAYGYDIPGIKVDGNDFFAMYKIYEEAKKYALEGNGPVLIEALTYRKGAHTTSDDPTLYRTSEEENEWDAKDPIDRMRKHLIKEGLWTEDQDKPMLKEFRKEVDKEFSYYENYPAYKIDDVFKFLYADMPDELKIQKVNYEKYLNWLDKQNNAGK
jgi:pyruvate dehydrogenase E1 component alpha subunit